MIDTRASATGLEFSWNVRVTGGPPHRADVWVRQHRFAVGRPVDFDSESDSVSALEYVLGALGADVVNGLRAVARRRRLHLDRVEATVEGRLGNPLVHLAVVGERGDPALASARVKVYVSSLDAEDEVRSAWREALELSPLVRTLARAAELALELELVI